MPPPKRQPQRAVGRRPFRLVLGLAFGWAIMSLRIPGQVSPSSPLTVTITEPAPSATVTGTITVTALANSLVGPVKYVEFYRDDVWFATVWNPAFSNAPGPLRLASRR